MHTNNKSKMKSLRITEAKFVPKDLIPLREDPIPITDLGYFPFDNTIPNTQTAITNTGIFDNYQWTYTNTTSSVPTSNGTVTFDAGIKTLELTFDGRTYSIPNDVVKKELKKAGVI